MAWMYAMNPDGSFNSRKGDSGGYSVFFRYDKEKGGLHPDGEIPKVGGVMRVGSLYARSYSAQDYWQTSLIEEIISDEKVDGLRRITFRTMNSVYVWTEGFEGH